jgi:transposase InsO family protein
VITALVVEKQTVAEVAERYGVHRSWVYRLKSRYDDIGEAAFEPLSRRPKTSPTAIAATTVELIRTLRKDLSQAGLDAGPDTIAWHLAHRHQIQVSVSTVARTLTREGLVTPEPDKRPKSSYLRFEAAMPNECWQSDFTHYALARSDGPPAVEAGESEIISWLDDCARYALRVTAHHRVTTPIVLATFRKAAGQHGIPASTLTDNGMVYTVRYAGGRAAEKGRNGFETQLRDWHVVQKNSRPNHPTTCGKVERFQQTMKKWLRAQPVQPATISELQTLLDAFVEEYNHRRPHRSLPHRATPAAVYESMPKALPGESRDADTHDRVRHDKVSKTGNVTLRVAGKLRHIGVGRTHKGTHVLLLTQDLDVRIVDAITGELLRELTINPALDYQPQPPQMTNNRTHET